MCKTSTKRKKLICVAKPKTKNQGKREKLRLDIVLKCKEKEKGVFSLIPFFLPL